MAFDPDAVKAAFMGALTPALAAATTTPQVQQAFGDALGVALALMVTQLQVSNPLGLATAPGGGPVTGSTAPGSIT